MTTAASETFHHPVRVYWEDTDGGGIVYYANYLRFMERARTEWLRAKGWSQQALSVDPGILFTVVRVELDYVRPARLDDALLVSCTPQPDGRVAMRFLQEVRRERADGELLASGSVRVACVDARTLRPRRLPGFLS